MVNVESLLTYQSVPDLPKRVLKSMAVFSP
jgi:hypothetical protein